MKLLAHWHVLFMKISFVEQIGMHVPKEFLLYPLMHWQL